MGNTDFLYDDTVALRALERADVPRLLGWINDQAVLHYLKIRGMFTEEQEEDWLEKTRESTTDMILGIERKEDRRLVGTTGLHGISSVDRHAEYGIMLGDRTCWGQGLGTAAGRLIIDYGFNRLNLHRIFLEVLEFNPRGTKSYENLGFVHEGRMRQHEWKDGSFHDMLFMGLLRDEFNERWADWREQQRKRYGIGE